MEERREIERFIEGGFDSDIADRLSDEGLMPALMQTPSVLALVQKMAAILRAHDVALAKIPVLSIELASATIPAGTKGAIRGKVFNDIIHGRIVAQFGSAFDVGRETRPEGIITDEIPDWWVRDRASKRVVVGFNQIDLWSGGAQLNRGAKYLRMTIEGARHICVVNAKVALGSATSKKYGFILAGMRKRVLCFPRQLTALITEILAQPR